MTDIINSVALPAAELSVSALTGVGAAKTKAFNAMGVFTLGDLIEHYPRAYQHRGDVKLLTGGNTEAAGAYILTVSSEPKINLIRKGMSLLKFKAFDESGVCDITYFNQDYMKNKFRTGDTFRFWGKLTVSGNKYQMTSPAIEPYTEGIPLPELLPVYPLSTGLSQKFVSHCVSESIKKLLDSIADPMPGYVRKEYKLSTLRYAIENIHVPVDIDSLTTARRRIMFDELFTFALSLSVVKKKRSMTGANVMANADISPLMALQPYSLTGAQSRAIAEIANDMQSSSPMSRIVVGDVGCGKTICAAAAAFISAINGYQTAFMAPTEILANQHYEELKLMFEKLGLGCALLTGSVTAARKKKLRDQIKNGDETLPPPALVIGTHALLEDNVKFANLGLVITDEQHRFGVMQRASLADKSKAAHVLVMSATPIPRTLSLILYGDLDVSIIDEMPPGRQRVDTFVVTESYRLRLNEFIRKQVSGGHQVYIVCPSVDEAEKIDADADLENYADYDPAKLEGLFREEIEEKPPLKAAVTFAKELSETTFPDLRIGFVHGKLKSTEKEKAMTAFCAGEIDILVSTTVIEVGVNVPNATLMIVENADRFGLSQLHQLRGRVGRGNAKSYCILVSDSQNEKSIERLTTMKTTCDGYKIAEKDLTLRGPGDLFGDNTNIKQHGGTNFKLAKDCADTNLLNSAFQSAKAIIQSDPTLEKTEHEHLKNKIKSTYEKNVSTLS